MQKRVIYSVKGKENYQSTAPISPLPQALNIQVGVRIIMYNTEEKTSDLLLLAATNYINVCFLRRKYVKQWKKTHLWKI